MPRTVNRNTRCAGIAYQFMRDRDAMCCIPTSRSRVLTFVVAIGALCIAACARHPADDTVTEYSAQPSVDAARPVIITLELRPVPRSPLANRGLISDC